MVAKSNTLKKTAVAMTNELIAVAMRKRKWTKHEQVQWDRALTALRKLAGSAT